MLIQDFLPLLLIVAIFPLSLYFRRFTGNIPSKLQVIMGACLGPYFLFRLIAGIFLGKPTSVADLMCFVASVYLVYAGTVKKGVKDLSNSESRL